MGTVGEYIELKIPTNHLYFLGGFCETLCFAMGLGYKQHMVELEKIAIQKDFIAQLEENQQLQTKVNRELEEKVTERTRQIQEQKEEIISQNEELTQQGEELAAQRDLLEKQNQVIAKNNEALEETVRVRTAELVKNAEELQRQFSQLEQFSFITAHNLRGPVSRILGLAAIFNRTTADPDNIGIIDRLIVSTKDLDNIIHDLGKILEVQQGKPMAVEIIEIKPFIDKILSRFASDIEINAATVNLHLQAAEMKGVPTYLDSILSNLISNSLKYRNPQKPLVIDISVNKTNGKLKWTVRDNGLGFDTEKFTSKVFKPFQRFHTHVEGKGLGLFLIKTQVESMGGEISLQGKEGNGLVFVFSFPD
jgi:signal transduction histidine kinase